MNAIIGTVIGTFLVIMGGISALYFKLGSWSAITASNVVRIQRLEESHYKKQ